MPDELLRRGQLRVALALTLFAATAAVCARGVDNPIATEAHGLKVVIVTEGLEHPSSLAWLPDGRMLITEKTGRLRIANADGTLRPRPIGGLPPIVPHGQGGLFDVAVHPRYAENQLVYLAYSGPGDDGIGTELARGKLAGDRLENVEILFRQTPKGRTGRHFGGRIVFDGKGHVFLTLGDRGEEERGQALNDHAGSVIRLYEDGRVPEDNPFVGRKGVLPEKFTIGNRNQQGAAIHPVTGELWTHEHGPQGGDEVNVIRAGANYGWATITYGVNYGTGTKIGEGTAKAGMEQPLHYWVPSIGPSGMAFYTGEKFPRWKGDLLVGALRDQMLVRLRFDGERFVHEERMLKNVLGRIRDVRVGPDGYVYVLTDDSNGVIARLEPAD